MYKEYVVAEFQKGGNNGGYHNRTTDGSFAAFTAVKSRSFKTQRGAANWLEKQGYWLMKKETERVRV